MPHDRKIATCCYCGRRTVLELTARGGHELACGSCGAPLHEMKALKPPSGSAKYALPKPRPCYRIWPRTREIRSEVKEEALEKGLWRDF